MSQPPINNRPPGGPPILPPVKLDNQRRGSGNIYNLPPISSNNRTGPSTNGNPSNGFSIPPLNTPQINTYHNTVHTYPLPEQQANYIPQQQQPPSQQPPSQQPPLPPPQQGQQANPVRRLNIEDALTYLDQVKSYYQNNSEVYNNFLDIMKDFNTQKIDTPGVIDRVSSLFGSNPILIQGFNTFLPPDYNISYSMDPNDPAPIKITTPSGTISRGMNPNYTTYTPNNETQLQQADSQAERKTEPIEMDDAINYVNKIKIRFTKQPEIYNNFIEILQTFQREQKPIQEIYLQISILFRDAPDLLADFQKFLPDISGASVLSRETQQTYQPPQLTYQQPTKHGVQLPPVGNFSPSAIGSVDGKQYNKNESAQQYQSADVSHERSVITTSGSPNDVHEEYSQELRFFDNVKRHIGNKEVYNNFIKLLNLFTNEVIDKMTLVEKAYNFIGSSTELFDWFKNFLKLDTDLNEKHELTIKNVKQKKAHFEYNLLPSCGPSYRKLPKLEGFAKCSGRDEMCWSVLNDECVGHPTWASEDSGFVAHKKNEYEEVLFKIEEERHEYDYYLEANVRTIQTLETIAKQILTMSPEEKEHFNLKDGLRTTSQTIYKKVLRKVYGDESGLQVIDAIQNNPIVAIPIVLRRLKLKDEEWKRAQREWNKVWREQEQKVYFKSLDHLGLSFKKTDKKYLNSKQLVTEINGLKLEEMHKKLTRPHNVGNELLDSSVLLINPQLKFQFADLDVLVDVVFLLFNMINSYSTYSLANKKELIGFVICFLNLSFNLDEEIVKKMQHRTIFPEEISEKLKEQAELSAAHESNVGGEGDKESPEDEEGKKEKKKAKKGKKNGAVTNESTADIAKNAADLALNKALDSLKRTRSTETLTFEGLYENLEQLLTSKKQRKDLPKERATNTHESTTSTELTIKEIISDTANWVQIGLNEQCNIDLEDSIPKKGCSQTRRRSLYNFFGNTNIYFFFRLIAVLYERLLEVKELTRDEAFIRDIKSRKEVTSFAKTLDLNYVYDNFVLPSASSAMAPAINSSASAIDIETFSNALYAETLELINKLLEGSLERSVFEETLRQTYFNKAYKLFSFQKILQDLTILMKKVISTPATPGTNVDFELFKMFESDRMSPTTTIKSQIIYETRVRELIGKEESLFRISVDEKKKEVQVSYVGHDDLILANSIDDLQLSSWQSYLSNYLSLDHTKLVMANDGDNRQNSALNPFIEMKLSDEKSKNLVKNHKDDKLKIVAKDESNGVFRVFFSIGE